MSSSRNRTRLIASILVTVIILGSVLALPTSVAAISVSISASEPSGTAAGVPYYYLGATVRFPASVNFDPGDSIPIQQVALDIQGPRPLTLNLPVAAGAFSYPLTNPNRGTVSGTATWNNVSYGYGYGYGSNPNAPSNISYQINWQPPPFA